jgi:hypothetical protein
MGYSKAYQEVEAGRVREDEAISFFGNNLVAVPDRTHVSVPVGTNKFPEGKVDYLKTPEAGKTRTENEPETIDTHLPGSYNTNA